MRSYFFTSLKEFMSSRSVVLSLILLGLIGAGIVFYPQLENSIIFHPDRGLDDKPSNWGLIYEDILFPTPDGQTLHGWFFPGSKSLPLLLFCHGNAGNICHRIENVSFLVKKGISVLLFDYRGYGQSTGKPSERGIYIDGIAAYDYLTASKKFCPEEIAVFGRSLGGAVALEIALQRKVRCLIIESTFTSTRDMSKRMFPFFVFSPFLPHHYHNSRKIRKISVPKLIIHGKNDKIVPFAMGKKLFEQSTGTKEFLPIDGAGHNDTYIIAGEPYFDSLSHFITRTPRGHTYGSEGRAIP